jgi:predicted lipoprotein with Yx(FWY)xxD motif
MSTIRRAGTLAASAAAILAFATACGSSGHSATTMPTSPGTSSTAPATPAPASTTVKVTNNGSLGQILTDTNGFTLYRFDTDTNNPPTSNCNTGCIETWPAATVTGQPTGTGVDASQLGTITRSDGSKQLTFHGWPLYRYAGDSKAGQTNGQGVAGTWWAVTPSGGKAMAASMSPTAPPSTGGGY